MSRKARSRGEELKGPAPKDRATRKRASPVSSQIWELSPPRREKPPRTPANLASPRRKGIRGKGGEEKGRVSDARRVRKGSRGTIPAAVAALTGGTFAPAETIEAARWAKKGVIAAAPKAAHTGSHRPCSPPRSEAVYFASASASAQRPCVSKNCVALPNNVSARSPPVCRVGFSGTARAAGELPAMATAQAVRLTPKRVGGGGYRGAGTRTYAFSTFRSRAR